VLYVYFELGCLQREGMGLLEDRAMPSYRDVAHDVVLCKLSDRSATDRGEWCVHHVRNHTLLGHSLPASQAGRRIGPAL
jgi:hypothetical protein